MPLKTRQRPPEKPARSSRAEEKGGSRGNGKSNKASLASAFDNAKPQGFIDEGKYEGLLIGMELMNPNAKGSSARAVYEIASDGDFQGSRITQYYQLLQPDGSEGKGLGYLKRDLAVLGKGDVRFSELEDCFAELTKDLPGVFLTIKQNDQYTNAYLNGICEEKIVDAWRDERPNTPF